IWLSDVLTPPYPRILRPLLGLPLPARLILYYVLGDLGLYLMHRLMHTAHVWRVHRWHHSPRHLYWLSGVRATVPHQVLFILPFGFLAPLLHGVPGWVFVVM